MLTEIIHQFGSFLQTKFKYKNALYQCAHCSIAIHRLENIQTYVCADNKLCARLFLVHGRRTCLKSNHFLNMNFTHWSSCGSSSVIQFIKYIILFSFLGRDVSLFALYLFMPKTGYAQGIWKFVSPFLSFFFPYRKIFVLFPKVGLGAQCKLFTFFA